MRVTGTEREEHNFKLQIRVAFCQTDPYVSACRYAHDVFRKTFVFCARMYTQMYALTEAESGTTVSCGFRTHDLTKQFNPKSETYVGCNTRRIQCLFKTVRLNILTNSGIF